MRTDEPLLILLDEVRDIYGGLIRLGTCAVIIRGITFRHAMWVPGFGLVARFVNVVSPKKLSKVQEDSVPLSLLLYYFLSFFRRLPLFVPRPLGDFWGILCRPKSRAVASFHEKVSGQQRQFHLHVG